ncbi:SDR family oxidoreductase [Nocardiopsis sediminis]|uniref:SDR family oxidoreductase n=1 Tax=Nocardiopsis sediminis TaxID=1778267 RepID=A0ABV8FPI3_9ACTN
MSPQTGILVIGATGNVGRNVVAELVEQGTPVRALTRRPGRSGLPPGADVVQGDLTDPASLKAALDGIGAVFLVWPFLTADDAPDVLGLIAEHARRVVYLSSSGVDDDAERQADPINRFHADVERTIRASGVEWTFLRAGGFATNNLEWAQTVRTERVVRAPFPNAARSLIHERDIAAVGVRALTEDGHVGAVHILTGPASLTLVEQVDTIASALDLPVRYEEVPPGQVREQMLGAGWPAEVVDGILGHHDSTQNTPDPVTTTVEDVTGAPARTFRQWVLDHADDFR